jgi:GABA(A) receptor-associated protein
MSKFKLNNTFEKRKKESGRIIIKYNNRIPIIVEVNKQHLNELILDKYKYLVPFDLTVGQFLYVLRKRLKISSEKALFILFNNELPPNSDMVSNVYKNKKDDDGFLYATVSLESTFG